MELIRFILKVLSPLIYGIGLAYLLSPMQNFFERKIFRFKSQKKFVVGLRRTLSLTLTLLIVLIILAAAVGIFIPQIVNSYNTLANNVPNYLRALNTTLDSDLNETFGGNVVLVRFYESAKNFLGVDEDHTMLTQLIDKVTNWLLGLVSVENVSKLFSVGASVVSTAIDATFTLFCTIFLLWSKERQLARIKKVLTAFFKKERVKEIYRVAYLADERIGHYLRLKVLDSFLIGVISYFVYMICGLPFYPILALITGVTNVVPYFGPIFGAVPNAIFVLLAAPDKVFLYILLILLIQQFDCRVLMPALESSSMNMDVFWVLVATAVMGGIFGVPGMILGVPVFSVIYILVKEKAEKKLADKDLPQNTDDYLGPYAERVKPKRLSIVKRIFGRKKNEETPVEVLKTEEPEEPEKPAKPEDKNEPAAENENGKDRREPKEEQK